MRSDVKLEGFAAKIMMACLNNPNLVTIDMEDIPHYRFKTAWVAVDHRGGDICICVNDIFTTLGQVTKTEFLQLISELV